MFIYRGSMAQWLKKMALPIQINVKSSLKYGVRTVRNRFSSLIPRRNIQTDLDETEIEVEKNKDSGHVEQRKPISISCGKYAGLANGCAVAEFGGSAVMATVVGKGHPKGLDIPLSVHYKQKAAAIGRIPTNFIRREIGMSDYEILTSRLIDRSLRPMFEPGHAIEAQIICNPLALDGANFPEPLAINAASAALACSDIPWNGPVAAARAALINHEVIVNPTKLELAESSANLMVTSTKNNLIVMLEGSFKNVLTTDVQMCIKAAVKYSKGTLRTIENLRKEYGMVKKEIKAITVPPEMKEKLLSDVEESIRNVLTDYKHDKLSRDTVLRELYEENVAKLKEDFPEAEPELFSATWMVVLKELYKAVVESTNKRCDGRGLNDLRPVNCETSIYEALHGSSVYKRGQTQVFCTVALDSPNSALRTDKVSMLISGMKEKNFFLHYDFPPYATGEVGIPQRFNRREIGHGNLAEKALNPTIPESFPFTIRLTSEVLESNGSSSMATVCGGTLALLDAGIPLEYPVAGVAMGLLATVKDGVVEDTKVLTDIMGMEDYLGDMDFKMAGTKTGFTALQLDMKVPGLSMPVLSNILTQGKKAFGQILKLMNERISRPRVQSKDKWPVIDDIEVPQYLKSKLMGFGGAKLKKLEYEVGVEIINFESDKLTVFAPNKDAMAEVKGIFEQFLANEMTVKLEFGSIYTATVTEVKNHGCFVSIHPSVPPAFISLSQLDNRKVNHPSALGLDVGSQFKVKYFGRDPVSGILRLSRKILLGRDESN